MNRRVREWLLVLMNVATLIVILTNNSYVSNPALKLALSVACISCMAVVMVLVTRDFRRRQGQEALGRVLLWLFVPAYALALIVVFMRFLHE